jgi:uncharacterized membrane protein YdjX (TVP38/TMEM64 family)
VTARIAALIAVAAGIGLFYWFDLQQFLQFATLKRSYAQLLDLYRANPATFVGAFMLIQIIALTFCLPGAVLTLALAGGAIFGPLPGTLIVLTALTIGDSLGFLAAKLLIGDWVRKRFARQLEEVEAEVDRNGAFYLLAMRLMAAIPYFVVNLTFGVTRMRLRTFAPVSFVGLAPATALYVNAGTRLSQIQSPRDVLSPAMVAIFALLALLPIAARAFSAKWLRTKREP